MRLGGGNDRLRIYDPCIQGPIPFIKGFAKAIRYTHKNIPMNDDVRHYLPESDRNPLLFSFCSLTQHISNIYNNLKKHKMSGEQNDSHVHCLQLDFSSLTRACTINLPLFSWSVFNDSPLILISISMWIF